MSRLRRLLPVLLLVLWIGNAHADGNTVSCSVTANLAGCYLERAAFSIANLTVSVGVDAQVGWSAGRRSHLAPYLLIAWNAASWGAWVEFAIPETGIPAIGKADAWRVGFTVRF